MISQESLYALIFEKDWGAVLRFLYLHKSEIISDPLLLTAAKTFESEFFQHLNQNQSFDSIELLEDLYLLHSGKFYTLSTETYRELILAIIRVSPEKATTYASLLPLEPICAEIIAEIKASNQSRMNSTPDKIPILNWITIFNRLFEIMNNPADTATYVSGPKFINTIRKFDNYFPDYQQYINLRNEQGKSVSRKIFYFDILMDFDESLRIKIVNRFLEMLRPFKSTETIIIDDLLGNKLVKASEVEAVIGPKQNPVVFISYSWDNETHKQWVLDLADKLVKEGGIDVRLDKYYLRVGKSVPVFIEKAIREADRIIVVYTPNYKLKAEKREGGVGYEYSILNQQVYNASGNADKLLPILRHGKATDSIPTYMQQFIHIDMSKDENFTNSFSDIMREIYDEPIIKKPQIGDRPLFDEKITGIVEELTITIRDTNGNIIDQETLK